MRSAGSWVVWLRRFWPVATRGEQASLLSLSLSSDFRTFVPWGSFWLQMNWTWRSCCLAGAQMHVHTATVYGDAVASTKRESEMLHCLGISNRDASSPSTLTPACVQVWMSLCVKKKIKKKYEGWEGNLALTRINCPCQPFSSCWALSCCREAWEGEHRRSPGLICYFESSSLKTCSHRGHVGGIQGPCSFVPSCCWLALAHFHVLSLSVVLCFLLFYFNILILLQQRTSRSWGSFSLVLADGWKPHWASCSVEIWMSPRDKINQKSKESMWWVKLWRAQVFSFDILPQWPWHIPPYLGDTGQPSVKGMDTTRDVCDFREAFNLGYLIYKMR